MKEAIYDRIGSEAAVDATVDLFYRKVIKDERISGFFDTTDMESQRAKQKSFLTMVFGGPHSYTGKDLRTSHAPLVARGLNDTHFDIVIEHLKSSLNELDVPNDLVEEVVALAETTRGDILAG